MAININDRYNFPDAYQRPRTPQYGQWVEVPAGPYRQGDYVFGTVITFPDGRRYAIKADPSQPYLHPGVAGWDTYAPGIEVQKQKFIQSYNEKINAPSVPKPDIGGPGFQPWPRPIRPPSPKMYRNLEDVSQIQRWNVGPSPTPQISPTTPIDAQELWRRRQLKQTQTTPYQSMVNKNAKRSTVFDQLKSVTGGY